jgi:hypothetical protein
VVVQVSFGQRVAARQLGVVPDKGAPSRQYGIAPFLQIVGKLSKTPTTHFVLSHSAFALRHQ